MPAADVWLLQASLIDPDPKRRTERVPIAEGSIRSRTRCTRLFGYSGLGLIGNGGLCAATGRFARVSLRALASTPHISSIDLLSVARRWCIDAWRLAP